MRFYYSGNSFILRIKPMIPRHSGTYTMEVILSDGYSSPFLAGFKVIVEDALSSSRTNNGKGLKDVLGEDKKQK
jgi:hypothetical protein